MKTKVDHIICKLHWCGKTDFTKNRRIHWNSWVLLGLHVRSWVLTGVHLFLLGCLVVWLLVVWLFVCLIVWLFLKPHPFFDLEKMGLKWRSLSDCSDGIGNKPQAGEHQEIRILWNLCERWAAIIFINKNHRLDGVLPVKTSGGQKHIWPNALQGLFVEKIQDTKLVVLLNAPPLECSNCALATPTHH